MRKKIVIIGAGGHGKVIADIAGKNGYEEIVFLDDNAAIRSCGRYPVIGPSSDAQTMDADLIVGIGDAGIRRRIQETLDEKHLVTLIHPQAVIAEDVTIGKGSVVMAGAVINPGAEIGKGCIINTCASVDHDCKLGDFVHISAGSHIGGASAIGDQTFVGIGVTVSNQVEITQGCIIGAGAVVIRNIEEAGTYIGVPARKLEK